MTRFDAGQGGARGRDAIEERTVVARQDPLLGSVLDDRFRIDFQLAAGGFGAIYRATDLLSDAEVALKVLLPQLARDSMVVARFRREGATLSKLRDPHTITAYEIGEASDGTLYIVMELLHGESLYERFRADGPLPWRRMVHIARGVCSSLAEAHAYGIVHRDLKPANIHLETHGDDRDFAKVIDFGIAKIVHGGEFDHRELTQTGQMIGTLDYMSPEQMVGGELTGQSDIYTLGIVMYEMISGRMPFADAQTATAILAAVLTQAPEPLSAHADVPSELCRIVMCCLDRELGHRFADVGELDAALAQLVEHPMLIVPDELDQTVLTGATTRVDVRVTDSPMPVLDVRGPRGRGEPVMTPVVTAVHSIDSETTHPAQRVSPPAAARVPAVDDDTAPTRQIQVLPAGVRPAGLTPTPAQQPAPRTSRPPSIAPPIAPIAAPSAHVPVPPPMMQPAPLPMPQARASSMAIAPAAAPIMRASMPAMQTQPVQAMQSTHMQSQSQPRMPAPGQPLPPNTPTLPGGHGMHNVHGGQGMSGMHGIHGMHGGYGAPPPPPARVRGYDMDAASTHDTLVRRIIWAVLVFLVLLVIAVATR